MIQDRERMEVRDGGGGAVALEFRWCDVAKAGASRDAKQARRLLALADTYEGGTRSEAARIGGVTLQIVRDWVVRFNADGPAGLVDRKPPGCCPMFNADQRRALAAIVEPVRSRQRTAWCAGA